MEALREQDKYERLWQEFPQYRVVAPGENLVEHFLGMAKPLPEQLVVDFGCGTGRAASKLAARSRVLGVDFAAGCLDPGVNIPFLQHDLSKPLEIPVADFGFCTDVLEHIPPEQVPQVLANITSAARRVYFCISTVEDKMGALIGEALHLTVQPLEWWLARLEELGFKVAYSQDLGAACVIYGSAWATVDDFDAKVALNVAEQEMLVNIQENLKLGLAEVAPHVAQDTEVMLLAGGPSLGDFAEEIIAKNLAGMPAITVNGAYNWLLEKGGLPGAQVIVDAREFNRRFTEPPVLRCKYLVSSQCNPTLVASLPRAQTWLWHGAGDHVRGAIEAHAEASGKRREWYPVPGGTTVILRALPLLAMLGFRKINIYGFDSCLRGDQHHAYGQPENDDERVIEVEVAGRAFRCHPWMLKQAHEFQEVVRHLLIPAGVELAVHGDGLISAILAAAAARSE